MTLINPDTHHSPSYSFSAAFSALPWLGSVCPTLLAWSDTFAAGTLSLGYMFCPPVSEVEGVSAAGLADVCGAADMVAFVWFIVARLPVIDGEVV